MELANFLTARGHKVILLIGEMATCKIESRARFKKIFSTTAVLRKELKSLSSQKVDAIFHAAAVSDFAFGKVFAEKKSGEFVALKASKKISTRAGNLLVELKPTPKIISELRGWFPRSRIIGWKFEADGKRTNAIHAAQRQLAECATDACVANGPAYGRGFGLVTHAAQTHFARRQKLFAVLEKLARTV